MARNRDLFRQVNERILELEAQWDSAQQVGFVCECGALGCTTPVYLTVAEYSAARVLADRFVVAPPHVDRHRDRVINETPQYVIVQHFTD